MNGVVYRKGSEELGSVLQSIHYSKPRKSSLFFCESLFYFSFTAFKFSVFPSPCGRKWPLLRASKFICSLFKKIARLKLEPQPILCILEKVSVAHVESGAQCWIKNGGLEDGSNWHSHYSHMEGKQVESISQRRKQHPKYCPNRATKLTNCSQMSSIFNFAFKKIIFLHL